MINKSEGWVESVVERYVEWAEFVPPPDGVVYESVSYNGAGPNWELMVAAIGVLLAMVPAVAWLWKLRPRKEPSLKDPRKGKKGKAELGAIGRGSERERNSESKLPYFELDTFKPKVKPPKKEGTKVVRGIAPNIAPSDDAMDAFKYMLETQKLLMPQMVGTYNDNKTWQVSEVKVEHGPPVPAGDGSEGLDAHDSQEATRIAHHQMNGLSDAVVAAGGGWATTWDGLYGIAMQTLLTKKRSRLLELKQMAEAKMYAKAKAKATWQNKGGGR